MATLAGNTIAGSYKDLLKIAEASKQSGIDGTLRAVEDGDATASALYLATDSVLVKGDGVKLFFYDADGGEHISADASGNLTIGAGVDLNLTATTDINIPVNVGLRFGDGGENIETDNTDFTITSGNDIVFALGATGSIYHTGDGGTSNTIYGLNAGDALVSGGNYNVLIGEDAGTATTTGDNNVAVGYDALGANVTGGSNVAIGHEAMDRATGDGSTTSARNVAIGNQAMHGNFTTAAVVDCVAIGSTALEGTLTADASGTVAIGKSALAALTSGARNTALGYTALDALPDGSDNTAIGYNALGAANHADADHNTAIGVSAGDVITNGYQNTLIGSGADPSASGAIRQIAIGYGVAGQGNNTAVIGDDAMTALYVSSDAGADIHGGRLALGKARTDPTCLIDIRGSTTASTRLFAIGTDTTATTFSVNSAGTGAATYDATGTAVCNIGSATSGNLEVSLLTRGSCNLAMISGSKVGIGVAPSEKLHVYGGGGTTIVVESSAANDARLMLKTTSTQYTIGANEGGRGNDTLSIDDDQANAERLRIKNDGDFIGSSSADISDERMKENITDLPNSLDKINNLRAVSFTWKEEAKKSIDKVYLGLLAQNVEAQFPDVVTNESIMDTEDINYKSLHYTGLIAPLIKAVQELSAKIEALENA